MEQGGGGRRRAAPAGTVWSGAAMSGLFSLDDVKLLYQASQIPDGDDEKKSASLVPKMQNLGLFSKSKDKKGQAEEEEEEEKEECYV